MKRFKYILIIPVLIGLLMGCGAKEQHKPIELSPVTVKTETVRVSTKDQIISVSGKIEASNSANLSTRVMGNVTGVLVQPGDRVEKGSVLITISNVDLIAKKAQVEASIAQAKIAFDNAEKDYNRFKILYNKGSASEKELENMTARSQMAKAGLDAAEQMKREVDAQFEYTNLRSPFSGIVANTFVKAGDIAHPGIPLVTVEGTAKYEASVLVPESQITKVIAGSDATINVKSSNKTFMGRVIEVSPSAKNTGGQFLVKVALDESEGVLPGMFVNVDITIDSKKSVKTSPLVYEKAIRHYGQLTGIYTISGDNTAILRWVRIGKIVNGNVEVLSGISEGEKYIVEQEGKLYNGAKVNWQ